MSIRYAFTIFWIYNPFMASKQTRRGRLPKSPDKRKDQAFLLRMELAEKSAFAEAAELSGIPLASWMRERLRRAASIELEEAGRPVTFLERANHQAHRSSRGCQPQGVPNGEGIDNQTRQQG